MASSTINTEVLVVEDDPSINELIGQYIEQAGFAHRSVLNGNDAVNEARKQAPSVVVLDIMLPDIDGFEVCRQLKSDERTAHIPVIMVTALTDSSSEQRGLDCGAVAYVHKPYDPDYLLSLIERHAQG